MSHRAAILGGLSNGTCTLRNFLPSEDCLNTLNAMQALGAASEILDELAGYGPVNLVTANRCGCTPRPRRLIVATGAPACACLRAC